MSLYRIALGVFLIVVGFMYLLGLGRTWEVVAGIAGIVAGALLFLDGDTLTRRP